MGTIEIRFPGYTSPHVKLHWRENPCKGAQAFARLTAQEFYDAACEKWKTYCGRCRDRAHKKLREEGEA